MLSFQSARAHSVRPSSASTPSRRLLAAVGGLLAVFLFACAAGSAQTAKPETQDEKASYAIGVNMGRQLAKDQVDADLEMLFRGLREAFAGEELALTDEEMMQAVTELQKTLQQKQAARQQEQGAMNQQKGEAYLAENQQKAGVQVTDSGLQYEVLTEGTGPRPAATDRVKVHYHGTTVDGEVFDSSVQRGQPATFGVNQVIPGFSEALQLMPVGSKWRVVIPSDIAYGTNAPPGAVFGPDATLIFELELLEIEG